MNNSFLKLASGEYIKKDHIKRVFLVESMITMHGKQERYWNIMGEDLLGKSFVIKDTIFEFDNDNGELARDLLRECVETISGVYFSDDIDDEIEN
jgi:hypothetical protein